jgi:hypothetical protein
MSDIGRVSKAIEIFSYNELKLFVEKKRKQSFWLARIGALKAEAWPR